MQPEERRAALVAVTVPLLHEKGMAVSTRDIAHAAGVAEGTIFRVFASKEELLHEALHSAFDPEPMVERLRAVDLGAPLRERLVQVVTVLQERFVEIFRLLTAVGMVQPPHRAPSRDGRDWNREALELVTDIIRADEESLTVPAEQLTRLLRLLTFAGSHWEISHHQLLTPEEIVDTLLHGTVKDPTDRGTTSC